MSSRLRKIIRVLGAGLAAGLILSGCNEYYERPDQGYEPGYDPGYRPGYDGASDRHMVKNCELRVENKISRKLDYAPGIEFGYVDVSDISGYKSRIEGDAYVRDRNRRVRVDYRCIVDRDNGRVSDVKLDWRNKPGNEDKKHNAANTCKTHIRQQVQRDTKGQISLDFRKHDSNGLSGKRRRVTGKGNVIARRGTGKIGYECVVDTGRMRVIDANYRWIQKLPAGGNNGYDKDKAARKCHKATANKLQYAGYRNIKVKSTKFRAAGKADLMVEGKVKMSSQGVNHRARYECRVNGHNGKVKSATYKLIKK